MTFDVSEAAAPRSDQQNYEDYISGPKTVTVSEARPGSSEQPVEVHLVEFPGRPFKPSKTVLRILMAAWTKDASTWAGKRMTLYGDPSVKFGGAVVGGIRVSHLSHIDKPIKLNLTASRGKKTLHEVKPLPDVAPPTRDPIAAAKTRLWSAWTSGHDADPAALAEAYNGATGNNLADATVEDMDAFAATLLDTEGGEQA